MKFNHQWSIEITQNTEGEARGSAHAIIDGDLIRSPSMTSHDIEAVFQSLTQWIDRYEEEASDVVEHS